jgi:hypothetical protein
LLRIWIWEDRGADWDRVRAAPTARTKQRQIGKECHAPKVGPRDDSATLMRRASAIPVMPSCETAQTRPRSWAG